MKGLEDLAAILIRPVVDDVFQERQVARRDGGGIEEVSLYKLHPFWWICDGVNYFGKVK